MKAISTSAQEEQTECFTYQTRVRSASDASDHKSVQVKAVLNKSKFTVYLASCKKENKDYAMKVFPFTRNRINPCYLKEARFGNLSHPNIISVVESVPEKPSYCKGTSFLVSYILMELAPYGDLADLLMSESFPQDEKLMRTYFHQVIAGLEYLHSKKIAHLDIKPENILIGEDFNLKITDFDSSIHLEKETPGRCGTRNYRAPELKENNCHDAIAADIYSAGVLLFILKFGIFPYAEDTLTDGYDLYELMTSGDEKFWEAHPICKKTIIRREFKELFMSMVRRNPQERISLEEIKKSAWYIGPVYTQSELVSVMSSVMESLGEKTIH